MRHFLPYLTFITTVQSSFSAVPHKKRGKRQQLLYRPGLIFLETKLDEKDEKEVCSGLILHLANGQLNETSSRAEQSTMEWTPHVYNQGEDVKLNSYDGSTEITAAAAAAASPFHSFYQQQLVRDQLDPGCSSVQQ